MAEPKTIPLTNAEQRYLRLLSKTAGIIQEQHLAAQQRLRDCIAFLREQHAAPVGSWVLKDIQIGFERIENDGSRST